MIFDDTKVPNIEIDLDNVEVLIDDYKSKFIRMKRRKYDSYKQNEVENLEISIFSCLQHLGDLSAPIFNLMDDISDAYFKDKEYIGKPKKAREDWLKYYRKLHERPDKLKNRIHRLIVNIEKYFPLYERKKENLYERIYK